MANLVRRSEGREGMAPSGLDPLRLMRQLIGFDPFSEMLPAIEGEGLAFAPKFDVKETKDAYLFIADLPGIKEEDLEITVTGNRITASGRREMEEREEGVTYYAYERSYGAFSRSFTLPEGADLDHVEAELKNGVLKVMVPKKPAHQPKKISLKSLTEKVKGALGVTKEKGQA
jgi:HSP20 family protein